MSFGMALFYGFMALLLAVAVTYLCATVWSWVWFNRKLAYLKTVQSEFDPDNNEGVK